MNISSFRKYDEIPLRIEYFRKVKDGTKKVEGRINSPPFSKMKEGDFFYFINQNEKIGCKVVGFKTYKSFREMLEGEGVEKCLPGTASLDDGVRIYDSIPTYKEKASRFGVVAIRILRADPPQAAPKGQHETSTVDNGKPQFAMGSVPASSQTATDRHFRREESSKHYRDDPKDRNYHYRDYERADSYNRDTAYLDRRYDSRDLAKDQGDRYQRDYRSSRDDDDPKDFSTRHRRIDDDRYRNSADRRRSRDDDDRDTHQSEEQITKKRPRSSSEEADVPIDSKAKRTKIDDGKDEK